MILRRVLIFIAITLVGTIAASAQASNIYISQSGSGALNGTSCANAYPVTFFNTSGNWGGGGTQIGPGTIVHAGGGITTTLTFQGSGTSGNPITLLSDCGGVDLTQPVGVLVNLNGQSNFVLDGAGTGVIENTANGVNLANQQNIQAILASGATNFEIRGWTCQNEYVAAPPNAAAGIDDTLNNCVYTNGAGGVISIHDNVMHDTGWAINLGGLANGSVVSIYNNNIYHMDHGIVCGDGSASYTCSEHDNHFHDENTWDTSTDTYHHDPIHLYNGSGGPGNWGTDIYYIYNNLFDGNRGSNFTADIFYENGNGSEPQVTDFGNVHIQAPSPYMSNGFVAVGDGLALGSLTMFDDAFIGDPTISGQPGVRIIASTLLFKNNILYGTNNLLSVESGSAGGAGIDYNLYTNQGAGGNYRWNWEATGGTNTFATWQSNCGTGCDAHSTYLSTLAINTSTGQPTSGSAAFGFGTNLSGVLSGALNTALIAGTTAGNTTSGWAQPATGPWTAGAYGVGGSPPICPGGTVCFDSTYNNATDFGTGWTSPATLTWAHTVAATGTELTVSIATSINVDTTESTSCNFAGTPMTLLAKTHADNSNAGYEQVFQTVNPPAGTGNVVCTTTGTDTAQDLALIGGSVSFINGGAIPAPFTAYGSGATASLTVTGGTSVGMFVGGVAGGQNLSGDIQTTRWLNNFNGNSGAGHAAQSTAAGASSAAFGYTVGGGDYWAVVGGYVPLIGTMPAAPHGLRVLSIQ